MVYMIKTVSLPLIIILIILLTLSSLTCKGKTIDNQELVKLLLEAKDKDERVEILMKNKDIITREFVEEFLKDSYYQSWLAYDDLNLEKAQKRLDMAMEMADFLDDNQLRGIVMLYKADAIYMNNLEESLTYYDKAMEFFQKDNFILGEAWCYQSRSSAISIATRYMEFDKVKSDMEKAIQIFHQLGMKCEEAYCIKALGMAYPRKAEYREESMECYNKALIIYQDIGSIDGEIDVYDSMSSYYYLYDYTKALSYQEMCLKLEQEASAEELNQDVHNLYPKARDTKQDKTMILAWRYQSLANLHKTWGKFGETIKNYNKGLQLLKQGEKDKNKDYLVLEAIFYEELGDTYTTIGKPGAGLDCYDKAIELIKKTGGPKEISGVYQRIGNILLESHMEEEAIKKYMESLRLLKDIDDPYLAGTKKVQLLGKLGDAYFRLENFNKAENYLTEAIKAADELEKAWYKPLYDLMSEVYLAEGKTEKALDYRLKSQAYRPAIGDLLFLSRIYQKLGDYEEAFNYAEKALSGAKEEKIKWDLWNFYLEEGKVLEALGDPGGACEAYKSSIEIIENTMNELKIEDYKRDFMRDKIEVYERLINLLLKMGKDKEAFEYNERARARAFLDILANHRIDIHKGADPLLMEKAEKLEGEIRFYSGEENRDEEKLLNLKKEYQKVLEELKQESPEYVSLKTVTPPPLEKIQSLLDKDTVLLEYFCGEKDLILWIITKDNIFTKITTLERKELNNKISGYREEIAINMTVEKLKSDSWKEMSKNLYSVIFGDIETYLKGKTRLIIVPHRSLHYLPFHTLINLQEQFLGEKYEISYLPSAAVLSYCREKNTDKKENLLAFEYGNLNIPPYPPLPNSITEVEGLKKLYPHMEDYREEKMTKGIVKNRSENADIIHFATHGVLDPESPMFSKLILADDELNVYEIFDMKLKAYLVTLSACQTGLGDISEGDDLVGFSRAFIYAGTPTVCVSLWNVSDMATSEFMERFYFYLKKNNKAQALRLAQIDIINKYPHPFCWAPFVLIGDWN